MHELSISKSQVSGNLVVRACCKTFPDTIAQSETKTNALNIMPSLKNNFEGNV
jgi:hypothetical protein